MRASHWVGLLLEVANHVVHKTGCSGDERRDDDLDVEMPIRLLTTVRPLGNLLEEAHELETDGGQEREEGGRQRSLGWVAETVIP